MFSPGKLIYTLNQFWVKSQEVHGARDAPVFPSLIASELYHAIQYSRHWMHVAT